MLAVIRVVRAILHIAYIGRVDENLKSRTKVKEVGLVTVNNPQEKKMRKEKKALGWRRRMKKEEGKANKKKNH